MPEFIGRPNIPNSLAALLTELIANEPSPAVAAIGAVKDIALGGLEGLAKSRAKSMELEAIKKPLPKGHAGPEVDEFELGEQMLDVISQFKEQARNKRGWVTLTQAMKD